MANVLTSVPATAQRGQTIEIKALIKHPMENGLRRDMDGKLIPRKIINSFVCRYNGDVVIDCDWHTAVAASPYMAFFATATDSGTIEFEWRDDDGTVIRHSAKIQVT
ncbi:MAG: thiosulfate oxidation carrier complex protein SoxZ [Proteobacteria bacterium]|nr:thiosulfate oxidation carrier complex protein SoxZ [Pseudomonadota bacterium]